MNERFALITGGSSGIGLEFAKLLQQKGYRLILIARDEKRLQEARNLVSTDKDDCYIFPCDVANKERLMTIAKEIKAITHHIDLLIVNAGIVHVNTLADKEYEEIERVIHVNLLGSIFTAKAFLPFLQSGSHVLFISSGLGLIASAGYSDYAASKSGVIAFAEALRREMLSKNVTVQVACPTDTDTPQYHQEKLTYPKWMKSATNARPVKAMSPKVAVERIYRKIGKNPFLILLSFDVWMLCITIRILPRRLRDVMIDKLLAMP